MSVGRFVWMGLAAVVVGLASCGGSSSEGGEPEAHGHAGGEHGDAHAGHGHHHHHHDSPAELRPLMRDMHGWLGDLKRALEEEDLAAVATSASAISTACDDEDLQELDPEQFGPRFLEIDQQLHSAAGQVAEAAGNEDQALALQLTRAGYDDVVRLCVACHAQAPTASEVDLGDLLPPGDF